MSDTTKAEAVQSSDDAGETVATSSVATTTQPSQSPATKTVSSDPSSADSQLSLSQLFRKCEFMYNRLGDLEDEKLTKSCAELVKNLEMCSGYVKQLALFSQNELFEDMSTSHLKYLLIDHYLAELSTRIFSPAPADRLRDIRQSLTYATKFMETCYRAKIMDRAQSERWNNQLKEGGGEGGAPRAQQVSREERIAAFKREKELKEYINAMEQKFAGVDDGDSDVDEEELREVQRARLEMAINVTFNNMAMLTREIEVCYPVQDSCWSSTTALLCLFFA